MMISTVRGEFHKVSGTVDFNADEPAKSAIDVKIDVASVDTRDEKRDGHLKSADFFDAEKFPVMEFKSDKIEELSKTHGKVHGTLTIKGVSKPVVLDVEYNGTQKSPWGTTNAGFSAKGKINRKDWGLNWNVALESGGILVGDDIKIDIEAEIVKQA
jgi:polyisoprenoid-binding protein YceI